MNLANMVFQGTVWGPTLWNVYFGDCICAIRGDGFDAIIYADDCNCFKVFPGAKSNDSIFDELRECQSALHTWGRANAVSFDAGKEDFMIISNVDPVGGPIKLLGVDFDNKLRMHVAVHKCATKGAFKTKALLRTRRFFSVIDLVMMFKSHIVSYLEYRTPGIYHACSSILKEIDDVQRRFLEQLGLSEEDAFMHFNLAPLSVRRDIAMLGVIHRAALRKGPPALWPFFRLDASTHLRVSARGGGRHSMHLVEETGDRRLEIVRRSIFGLVVVYNLLPESVVAQTNVSDFQRELTNLVRDRVVAREHLWKITLSPRSDFITRRRLLSA